MADLDTLARTLRSLHRPGEPLLLANAWDVVSAKLVEELGFSALATSSHAVADAFGEKDDDCMPADVAFGAVHRMAAAVSLPVTADLEAGYQLPAKQFAQRLLAAGAVGCNLEDSSHHAEGPLVEMERQAEYLRAVKDAALGAGVDIVINARVDTFVRRIGEPDLQFREGVRRARAYLAAGADCVYPIFLADQQMIGAFVNEVGGAVNIMLRPGAPSVAVLAGLGVARISLASGLHRAAMTAARQAAESFRTGTLYAG